MLAVPYTYCAYSCPYSPFYRCKLFGGLTAACFRANGHRRLGGSAVGEGNVPLESFLARDSQADWEQTSRLGLMVCSFWQLDVSGESKMALARWLRKLPIKLRSNRFPSNGFFLDEKSFRFELARERMRVDRNHSPLAVLTIELPSDRASRAGLRLSRSPARSPASDHRHDRLLVGAPRRRAASRYVEVRRLEGGRRHLQRLPGRSRSARIAT